MTGFVAKELVPPLEKEVQTEVLKMWVEGKSLTMINSYLHSIYSAVLENNVDVRKLIKEVESKG